MDEMKYESDYMNEMLNRDYDVDIDEDDLDDEMGELERELKAEKIAKKKEVNPQQQELNKQWFGLHLHERNPSFYCNCRHEASYKLY